jgi:hypothetical protein
MAFTPCFLTILKEVRFFFINSNKKYFFNCQRFFLLSFYDSHESIGFVHGKSNEFIEVLEKCRLGLFIDKKFPSIRQFHPKSKFVSTTSIRTTEPI